MKRIMLVIFLLGILFCSSLNSIPSEAVQKTTSTTDRPYHIITNGNFTKGTKFFMHSILPLPNQMYFSLLGIVKYETGETTITNTDTGKTVERNGAHTVIFYRFYGPLSNVNSSSGIASFEGDAKLAMAIGG